MPTYDYEHSPLGERGRNVLPASQFLHERLQERRARNLHPKRARHTDVGLQRGRDDDIFLDQAVDESRSSRMYDSSPMAPGVATASEAGGQGSDGRRRAMGVRDMDLQFDRLNKQNFALKLELDHRREQTVKLQQQVDSYQEQINRAQVLEDEHKELLRLNSELVQELEKRDKAVEEAMDIICDLEDRVRDLEEHHGNTRPSTALADSGYAGTETQEAELRSSPPEKRKPAATKDVTVHAATSPASAASQKLQGFLNAHTPAKAKREPLVLSSHKPSTHALRSVYLGNAQNLHPVKSFQSLLSRQESRSGDDGEDLPNSPRLSVLSESSFPSIYSPKKHVQPEQYSWEEDDDAHAAFAGSRNHLRQDSIKRVSQWIIDPDLVDTTPSKSKNMSSTLPNGIEQRVEHQPIPPSLNDHNLEPPVDLRQYQRQLRRQNPQKQGQSTTFAGSIFGDASLPPTPESASTRMLRASRSSIADDKSLLDTTPVVVKGFDALEPGVRTAPRQMRSSVELRNAFATNLQFRSAALDGLRDVVTPREAYENVDADTRSEIDYGLDYDGFPDGKSLKMGTPSRFQQRRPAPVDIMFNMDERSPELRTCSPPRRRRSSEGPISSPSTKPRLGRMETSPTIFGSLGRMMSGNSVPSAETVISPQSAYSQHSGSSGGQTIVQTDGRFNRALSPEAPRAGSRMTSSVKSPSPARMLTKKTQGLFRRLSNSQGGDREVSPLPTLTSAHSSTYNTNPPLRPKTSHAERPGKGPGGTTVPRPPSSRDDPRPSLATRTRTEPAAERPASAAGTNKEKRSFFGRSNSVKHPEGDSEMQTRDVPHRRRGSIREAVTSRRPWR